MMTHPVTKQAVDQALQNTKFSSSTKSLLVYARNPEHISINYLAEKAIQAGIPVAKATAFALYVENRRMNGAIVSRSIYSAFPGEIDFYIEDYYYTIISNPKYILHIFHNMKESTLKQWMEAEDLILTFIHIPMSIGGKLS